MELNAKKERKHYACDVSEQALSFSKLKELSDSKWLVEEAGGAGLLFSNHMLDYYLDEEYRHGKTVLTSENDDLKSKSSGERKKLLLDYQLKQQPSFLILDNPFDALDVEKVAWFRKKLQELATTTTLIQLYRREEDLLPFINTGLVYEEKAFRETELKRSKVELEANSQGIKRKQLLTSRPFVQHLNLDYRVNSVVSKIPQPLEYYEHVPESLIKFDKVSVSFDGKPIIDTISWEVKKGETWHLKGPNGSGKTTLLSMITGDNTKGYGKELYVFGRKKGSGESVWEIKQKIGYFTITMTERFDGMHTVLEMVISGLHDSVGLYQKPTTLEITRAEEWIELIGLTNLKLKAFRTLDEVQKRLVLIARAMIKHPPLLILDEPTSSLNTQGAQLLVNLINKIAGASETAILYVSHRKEDGLNFENVLELEPSQTGSRAVFKQN
ncbi:ATP-binding cassette domain-containing protein [Leeuwenhoekiella marinoflava]|uniref:Molybdate transport system ATP-binding protein n=2 Tax=Leeuwenhoekiella marinoflava TaxID=988 RepID=A0A4Q0PNW2_9FLAO|nr:ATP-binding cassette domain-containing protein [Leeuwenhoekiella marinoflava]RXG30716.1 molybdate transport system ATP-binding protein [Leeuwenhoekiella marinoflava]SHF18820.1 molybdate transport system ATP-binding protein [Leeuwenhoekiella marinoflava DSM 3653]